MDYDWPGNVRQLEHAIEMAVTLSGEREKLYLGDIRRLPDRARNPRHRARASGSICAARGINFEEVIGGVEKLLLQEALRKYDGNKAKAANILGLQRTTLMYKIKALRNQRGVTEQLDSAIHGSGISSRGETQSPNAFALPVGWSEMGVPIAIVSIVIALITPMPAFLLDFLIVVDIMLSVIVMMVSVYIRRPVDFNVFPTTLLLLTLYRLALNISSARLILLNGNTGTSAAGHVIEAFGSFVVGGNYIIGAVIFLVLIAIQYVVINHGAVRISEVTARFTLDALPGKQMSIDADLNSGLDRRNRGADPAQATVRRSGVLRRDGRRVAVHAARRRGQHSDHRHQHHCRIPDRRVPARHGTAPARSKPIPFSPSATAW